MKITVNGRERQWSSPTISYADVMKLAIGYDPGKSAKDSTVHYRYSPKDEVSSLTEYDDPIEVKNFMLLVVVPNGSA